MKWSLYIFTCCCGMCKIFVAIKWVGIWIAVEHFNMGSNLKFKSNIASGMRTWYLSLHVATIIADMILVAGITLQWRHNGRDSVSNHQPHLCLLNRLFRRRSKKTSKLHVIGLCEGNSPVTSEFPAQMASCAENVSIWWRHHDQTTHKHDIETIRQ